MTSRAHGSELALASLACRDLAAQTGRSRPRVLIGGLGFGYTLRAALDSFAAGNRGLRWWELSAHGAGGRTKVRWAPWPADRSRTRG